MEGSNSPWFRSSPFEDTFSKTLLLAIDDNNPKPTACVKSGYKLMNCWMQNLVSNPEWVTEYQIHFVNTLKLVFILLRSLYVEVLVHRMMYIHWMIWAHVNLVLRHATMKPLNAHIRHLSENSGHWSLNNAARLLASVQIHTTTNLTAQKI